MDKPIEQVLSGDQMAAANGGWNRIHAVRISSDGRTVCIDHDRKRNVLFLAGITVQVRSC